MIETKQKIHDLLKDIIQKHGKIYFNYRIKCVKDKYGNNSKDCDYLHTKNYSTFEDNIDSQIDEATSNIFNKIHQMKYKDDFSHFVNG